MGLHKDLSEANLHEPKGVSTALINQVYIANGAGSGAFTKYKPDRTIHVNAMSDFPAPSGGVITLADRTTYVVGNDLSTADRFVCGISNTITTNSNSLTYTGTGDMFTSTNVTFSVTEATLNCSTAQFLNMTGPASVLLFDFSTIISCTQIATFTDIFGIVINRALFASATQGMLFAGTGVVETLNVANYTVASTSATFKFLDLGSIVFNAFTTSMSIVTGVAGAIGIEGIAASGNMTAGAVAIINNVTFASAMTPLSNIDPQDVRWEFQDNKGVLNSNKSADTFITATQLVTIGTIGVFVVVNGGGWTSDVTNRFSSDSAGKLTYTSESDEVFLVSGTATISKVGGGSDVLEMRIAKNGTTLAKSGSFTQSADPTTVMSQALVDLTKDDTLELFVANNTSTANIDVNVSALIARASG